MLFNFVNSLRKPSAADILTKQSVFKVLALKPCKQV